MAVLGGADPLLDGVNEFFFGCCGEEGFKVSSVGGRTDLSVENDIGVAGGCGCCGVVGELIDCWGGGRIKGGLLGEKMFFASLEVGR